MSKFRWFKYLYTSNKILIYKATLKLIWAYGIQLWGTASTSNIEILERFKPEVLGTIVEVPWYLSNTVIWRDLQRRNPSLQLSIQCASAYTQTT
jgi:hypothetical protein